MNLERGFCRIVGTVSLAFFFAALGLTGYITYRGAYFLSANATYRKCVRQAGYDLWVPGLRGEEELARERKMGQQQGVFYRCRLKANFSKDSPPNVLYGLWGDVWTEWSLGKFILLTSGIGVMLSVAAVAITWGVFYLIRWIARGFL